MPNETVNRSIEGDLPLVSVVVVNHNRAELLLKCLASLLAQDYVSLEVVIVDNASTDGSLETLRQVADERIALVELPENLGFSGGCNAGIVRARGQWIALLNNDATADPAWLSSMVAAARVRPGVGMCAAKILFEGTRTIDKAGHLIFWDGQNRGRGTGETDSEVFSRGGEALFPDGCAALYHRELLEEAGGFDEDFFAYADDADLGLRARLLGWGCVYSPDAVVYHRHSATSGRFSAQKIYWVERNRMWLAVKTFPLGLLLLNPLFTLYRWAWNVAAAVLRLGPASQYRREDSAPSLPIIAVRAYRDGLKGIPRMWCKRRSLARRRRVSDWAFLKLLWRFRISARNLACRDFQGQSRA